ncbi:hypothetical protein [Defluviimonas salinarum]|uniref:Deoxynucleotide monophosphate kinase n=1 Tax=Defluviimonas salinarum TaxID=2992147 RepID=A0ABT3J4F3_9RHOB|nr:hypothetical protein [Defluviimonas salinarum]MCW3782553.1 hypothetical protein [Defluviimonas salinarum]
MKNIIIGLSGERQVGKSHIAQHLIDRYGFQRVHPFNGGKAACRGYFTHLGADADTAWRMTDGDLKDVPSQILPIISNPGHGEPGTHYAPRFYMEKLGQFMGVQLGPEWTIGAEMRLILNANEGKPVRLVAESIVYEADELRKLGGKIIEVRRPKRENAIVGLETDRYSATIRPDHVFLNDQDGLDLMREDFDGLLRERFGLVEDLPEYAF